MTQHDTWVTLKPNNPLSGIMHLFPDSQIPMRDPFPMGRGDEDDEKTALMVIDIDRLSSIQSTEILKLYAQRLEISHGIMFQQSLEMGGFPIKHSYVAKMSCGPEGFQRTKELANFLENNQPLTVEAFEKFYDDQYERWIDGDEQPPPLPGHIEGFDPRLRTPELEEALKQQEIEQELAGYSVFDVLTGRAMVDILNKQNPDVHYELVGLEEMLEDE